jgi:hypothetical protein
MAVAGNRRYKAIAALGNGLDVTGALGVILEDATNPPDGEVQAVFEIDERFGPPNSVSQFLAGDDLPSSRRKNCENLCRLRLEF